MSAEIQTEESVEHTSADKPHQVFSPRVLLGIVCVSLVYFADIFVRCSHKLYWYDELFTLYLCQLPTFKATWLAVSHGADFNPPLFYLITRASRSLFGTGLIATRLPETLGVWVFGMSLFTFISKRAGTLAGIIAGLFPFFTLAQYYAYEARPHGLVLGWCGLALLCWQKSDDTRRRLVWSLAFALCLLAAAMSHVYGIYLLVPFGLVELIETVRTRTVHWGNLAALCLVPAIAIPVYSPMLKAYRVLFGAAGGLMQSPQTILQVFFANVFGPAIPVFFLVLAAVALHRFARSEQSSAIVRLPLREILLALAFFLLPLVGLAGVVASHGIFFDRYFLASTAGWAILLGFGMAGKSLRSWVPGFVAACLLVFLLGDLVMALRHARPNGNFALTEPAANLPFGPGPRDPMFTHASILSAPANEDILVLRAHHYIYLYQYAPAWTTPHLYYGALPGYKMYETAYRTLSLWAHLDMKVATIADFVRTRDRFLVYGSYAPWQPDCGDCVAVFQQAGFVLVSETNDADGILYAYERQAGARPSQSNVAAAR